MLAACVVPGIAASAEPFPSRPLRVIVTYPPGGSTDIVMRAISPKLSQALGQQIVVDNRGGAGGIVGTELAVRGNPDGYTLLFGTSAGLAINPVLQEKLSYDPQRDLAPVSLFVINPQLLIANPSFPPNTVKELIALAKAKPGTINYASSGIGGPNHLGLALLCSMAGINMVHVPYRGSAQGITELIAGQVSLYFNSMPSSLPQIKLGKIKGIAIGSGKRSPAAPNIPTVAESGLPGFEYVTWYGLFAPARTPPAIIDTLNKAVVKVMSDPELAPRLAAQGSEPQSSTPQFLSKFMADETERWRRLIRTAGIKLE
jgi:tripartite-type tricarboxylate transporter receptor subunit TctC